MEFGLTPEQRQLQASVERTLADGSDLAAVRAITDGDAGKARALWAALTDLGAPAALIPEAHGGAGLELLDAALIAEQLGRFVAPTPFIPTTLCALAIARGGTEAMQGKHLPAIGEGRVTGGMQLGGSEVTPLCAGEAALLVHERNGSLELVEGDFTVQPLPSLDTTRPACRITGPGAGVRLEADPAFLRAAGWVLVAADTLGAASAMIDKAVAYSQERQQFGRPIATFQAVKHLCAEMAAALEPCRSLVWYAAYALGSGLPDGELAAAHAKSHLGEVGRFVARTSTEVHGGMGFTDLSGLPFWFRRIEANRHILGVPEVVRRHAAALQGLTA